MEAIHYQNTKGVLVLDQEGFISLSILSNSNTSGFRLDSGSVDIVENKDTFDLSDANGILVYKLGTTQNVLAVSCNGTTDSSNDKKTIRFKLTPKSIVPDTLSPGKFVNVTDVVLYLSVVIPQFQEQPVQQMSQSQGSGMNPGMQSLISALPPGLQEMVMKKSQNMNFQQSQQQQQKKILVNQPSGNIEMDRRVKEITDRMLSQTESHTANIMSSRPQAPKPVRQLTPGAGLAKGNAILNNNQAPPKMRNPSMNNMLSNLEISNGMKLPRANEPYSQQKADNLLKMLNTTLGKLT